MSVNQVLAFVDSKVPVLQARQRYTDLTTWYEGQTPTTKSVIKFLGAFASIYFVFRSVLFGAIAGGYMGAKYATQNRMSLHEGFAFAFLCALNSSCVPGALGAYLGTKLASEQPANPPVVL